jgi:uncharacterized protein (DUF1697 family)
MQYLCLLRGINVGGNNLIKMADLKQWFEDWGFSDVKTYIQSGNVLFDTDKKNLKQIEQTIERELEKKLKTILPVVVLPKSIFQTVLTQAPKDFGQKPDLYRYDVLFLKTPLTPQAALQEIDTNPEVDRVFPGEHALYFRRLISKATASRLNKIVGKPVYKLMTIRNWNTTNKLAQLFEQQEEKV